VSGSNGSFTVSGSHTYTVSGQETVKVTLSDDGAGTATATATSTANVRAVLSGSAVLTSATERVALPGTTVVASFTDGNTSDTPSSLAASINWGDGTVTPGTVSGGVGSFTVSGGHTYADAGSDAIAVVLTRIADNAQGTAPGTVTVAENDQLSGTGKTFSAKPGVSFSGGVASFTDTDAAASPSDFLATIDWGDGTKTGGSVSGGNGSFTVSGTHTYAATGQDNVTVTLSDDGAETATATAASTANVTNVVVPPAQAQVTPTSKAFGIIRAGTPAAQTLTIANIASAPAAFLDASIGTTTGNAIGNGSVTLIAPGASNNTAVAVGFVTASDGAKSGTVNINLSSDPGDGSLPQALPSQAVTLSATVYRLAQGQVTVPTGLIFHVGDNGTIHLGLSETLPDDGFTEQLDANVMGFSGNLTGAQGTAKLPAGGSNAAALSATIDTSSVGVKSGTVSVELESENLANEALGLANSGPGLGLNQVAVNATVDNLAQAALVSHGNLKENTATSFTLDLGTAFLGAGALTADLGTLNNATGPADFLNGQYTVTAGAQFFNSGFGNFTQLGAGSSIFSGNIGLSTSAVGTFSETITLTPTDANAAGFSQSLAPETVTVTGKIVAPPPPPPPPAPTGQYWGGGNLVSFSGLSFSFDAVGEFVLARSLAPGDNYAVQIRAQPFQGSSAVSAVTEVAAQLGADRVVFDLAHPGTVFVDGLVSALNPNNPLVTSLTLSGGTITALSGGNFLVNWNTGEVLNVTNRTNYFGVTTTLSSGEEGPGLVEGLLGGDNGQAKDFALHDGTVLPQPLSFTDEYTTFANGWRVTNTSGQFNTSILLYLSLIHI